MQLDGMRVTVVGAGVAGLATGLALAQRGAVVTVLEQADAIREVGAGLQVSPNGARVLHALGLGTALAAAGTRAEAVQLTNGLTGSAVLRMDLAGGGKAGAGEYRLIHRADLIGLLRDGAVAAGVGLRLQTRVVDVDLSGPRARLTDAQGDVHSGDLVVGADGLRSRLHAALNGTVAPFFTHQVAWRTTIPGTPGDPPVAEVHVGPGRHVVSYPLRGGALRNIVAVEERRRWVEEGWSLRDEPAEMRLAFKEFSPRVQGWMEAAGEVWLWGLFRHPVAPVWHAGGHSAILGDAAHPMLPFLAQGANMALEDAWTLGACLSHYSDAEQALAGWQALRAPRVARVVAAASRNARAFHLRGALAPLAHAGLRTMGTLAPRAALRRFDWLYRHDVTV